MQVRRLTMTRTATGKPTRPSRSKEATATSTITQTYARKILAPLGRAEAATAVNQALKTVLRDGTVKRERVRIYGPHLQIEKPRQRGGTPARMIWVRIRDRDRGVVHEVSVEAGKVVKHVVDADANPPFSDEERDEAYRLISNDSKLGDLLASNDVGIEWLSPGGHGPGRQIGARLVRVEEHRVIDTITEVEIELDEGVLHHELSPR
jgi:hypothetical protein